MLLVCYNGITQDVLCVLTVIALCVRPVRQQDGVRNLGHRLAAAANLPQGDAEEDSSEHAGRVLPPRVCSSLRLHHALVLLTRPVSMSQ